MEHDEPRAPLNTQTATSGSGATTPGSGATPPQSWAQAHKGQLISSLLAYPWLLMLIPAFVNLFSNWHLAQARIVATIFLAFVAVYVVSWWLLPAMPLVIVNRKRWYTIFGLMLALDLAAWWFSRDHGGAWVLSFYLISMLNYLAPRRWYLFAIACASVLGAVQVYVPQTEMSLWFFGFFPASTAIIVGVLRSVEDRDSARQREQLEAAADRQQRERERISADLHDLIGQTLTAIAVHADVAQKQLTKGRSEAAASSIATIGQLAREGVRDVRAVVGQMRELDLDTEVQRLAATSASKGLIMVVPEYDASAIRPEFRTLGAWLVREAATNIWHYAQAEHVYVMITPQLVAVVDDGKRVITRPRAGGNGLIGLRQRASNIATVEWGYLQAVPAGTQPGELATSARTNLAACFAQTAREEHKPWGIRCEMPERGFAVVAQNRIMGA